MSSLSASRLHGDVVIGELLAKWLLKLQPVTTSPYVLLSNLYASDRKWANLKNLSLAGNNFFGPTTDSTSRLESIQSLDFSCNSFSGDMAASLTVESDMEYNWNANIEIFGRRGPAPRVRLGGVLGDSLTRVARKQADALLFAEARKQSLDSLKREDDIFAIEEKRYDATGDNDRIVVNDGNILWWAQVLEPVRELPTNGEIKIRKCIYEVLEKDPSEWVKKILARSIGKENGYSDQCSPHVPTRWPDYSGHCFWLVSGLNA